MDIMKNIPNILTIIRLILAGVFPFIPESLQLTVIIIALATEYFDGALSRWFNWHSKAGALLDPIADKAFVFSAAFTMFFTSPLNWWQFSLIGMRDMVVFGGSLFVVIEGNWKAFSNVQPRLLGKIATTLQFAVLLSWYNWRYFNDWIIYSCMAISMIAGIDYLALFFRKNFYRDVYR